MKPYYVIVFLTVYINHLKMSCTSTWNNTLQMAVFCPGGQNLSGTCGLFTGLLFLTCTCVLSGHFHPQPYQLRTHYTITWLLQCRPYLYWFKLITRSVWERNDQSAYSWVTVVNLVNQTLWELSTHKHWHFQHLSICDDIYVAAKTCAVILK